MNLLETFDNLLQEWRHVFAQDRSFDRARRLTFGLLACLRQHLTSMAICATGRQFVDWSADYRLCSRSPWNPRQLFDPVLDRLPCLLASPTAPVIAALDDTLCKKTGKQIPGADFVRQSGKCLAGTVWAEFMPPVAPAEGEPVVVKKKYSGFFATDLELIIRSLDVETLFIGGVNTNNCVLHTAFDAHARDLQVIVLEDACGSMNGQAYHEAAIRQIEAAIGWTASVDEFTQLFAPQRARVEVAAR